MNLKTCVFGVVYPGMECFLDDYLSSFEKQTDKDFVLCLINEGVKDLEERITRIPIETRTLSCKGTPSELRTRGITWCKELGFDILVFSDTDDTFIPNRIAVVKECLSHNSDIVVNDLIPFGVGIRKIRKWLSPRLKSGEALGIDSILMGNCFGLSNTSIRMSIIENVNFNIPPDIHAFDWAFFSRLLNLNANAVFTSNSVTYYRQHSRNFVGFCMADDESIIRGVDIKKSHYSYMSLFSDKYNVLSNSFHNVAERLCSNEVFRNKYCCAVRKNRNDSDFWWEHIKIDKEFSL